ncbi:MAG TPA: pantoate--beta-alanine ligase [Solirubrobacteraceae bacterium]|nr:pantoate--beta-alanine ligase [Solirubrobacteraceae bacterium]
MRTLRSIDELRAALAGPRSDGARIGLVPTMGAFHEGHLSLMLRAREECDVVVISLFVNPAQFNEAADLAAYPRDERRDMRLAEAIGVDFVFAPGVEEMYPDGFATTVAVAGLSEVLEGAHRGRGHFDAVTTVVAKLFNIVAPEVAYFGQKDAQQALLIRRMVRDLAMPLRLEVCPIVREGDGLAMSSRNVHLRGGDRERATALHRSLLEAREAIAAGERDAATIRARALAVLVDAGVEAEYLELVTPEGLEPVTRVEGEVLAVVAARVGGTRLIDNERIQPLFAIDSEAPGPETGSAKASGLATHVA